MSILTLFSFNSIIGSFIPSQNLIISVPLQLRETVFNFIWGNILIYMPILATTFFAAGVISYELEQKTIYPLMSLPLSKEVILMGKLLSSFLATATVITIYILIQLITYVIAFGTFPSISFASYYSIALLVTFSDVAFGLAVSSFFNKSANSSIAFLIIYIVVLDIISLIFSASGLNPLLIKTNADRVAYRVFMNLDPYVLYYGGSISPAPFWELMYCIEVLLAYTGISIFVAYLSFSRRSLVK
ncbi:MAG: ABC transporter permease subunit [Thermoplasmataceae archaeon]